MHTEDVRIDPLLDIAIENEGQDFLGRDKFVADLYRHVTSLPTKNSYTIGITGPWGTGKTSALNLLRNRLNQNTSIILVDYNPWSYESSDALVEHFYSAIADSINGNYYYPQLSGVLRRYLLALSPILDRVGANVLRFAGSRGDLKANVEGCIRILDLGIVIVVDDLDRLHHKELLSFLKLVRLTGDFKYTIYVMAYDQGAVEMALKVCGVEPKFLEKIVHTSIRLPAVDQAQIDYFLLFSDEKHKSQIDLFFDKLGIHGEPRDAFDKDFVYLYQRYLQSLLPTLRSVKRFMSSLTFLLPPVKDEVNLLDFFLLEMIRLVYPTVYEDIWRNYDMYLPDWGGGRFMRSRFDLFTEEEDREKHVKAHLDAVLSNLTEKDAILRVIGNMFPETIGSYYGYSERRRASAEECRNLKMITHPDSFEKYFLLRVPEGYLADAEVEKALLGWQEQSANVVEATLDQYVRSSDIKAFLLRVGVFLSRISEDTARVFLRVLTAKSAELADAKDGTNISEKDVARGVILDILVDRIPETDRRAEFELILESIGDLSQAVQFVRGVASKTAVGIYELQQSVDIDVAKSIVVTRFRDEVANPRIDIFDESSHFNRPHLVLHQIAQYSEEARDVVSSYAILLCTEVPARLGEIVRSYITFEGTEHIQFNGQGLCATHDCSQLLELSERAGTTAWSSPEEQQAIELFHQFMKSRDSERDTPP